MRMSIVPQKWWTGSCGPWARPLLPPSLDLNLLLGQTSRKQQPSSVSTEPGAHLQAVPSPRSQMAKISHTQPNQKQFSPDGRLNFNAVNRFPHVQHSLPSYKRSLGIWGWQRSRKCLHVKVMMSAQAFLGVCFAVKQCREFCFPSRGHPSGCC